MVACSGLHADALQPYYKSPICKGVFIVDLGLSSACSVVYGNERYDSNIQF